ncbi:hypothetical protein [Sinorhizobium meliloti]|jgi:hypothetical protein|uniref:hypothetical protein n=1 Tax=Sinorhizobium TaxID=28105 RepID=UPI002D77694B|nr:hypothetical protein [Sinorhizobium meliloti]WRQ68122.1 hypothetical protein SO078_02545 [Sinorhizobium meliloti]
MDLMGGGSRSMHASRLLAVLWLFCASLSMQVIAVGQSAASRAAGAPAGNVAQPDTGSSDRPVARQICRAVALPDLRFSGERADGKSMVGGDPAPFIQLQRVALAAPEDSPAPTLPRAEIAGGAPCQNECIRAPPPSAAIV